MNYDDCLIEELPIRKKKQYEEIKIKLLEELPSVYFPPLTTGRKKIMATEKSKSITFGYGERLFMKEKFGEFSYNQKYPAVFDLLVKFGLTFVPKGFTFNSITLNKNATAKKHVDVKNYGHSVIIGIGNYKEGGIFVWDCDQKKYLIDIKNNPVLFNGHNLYHASEKKKGGDRYTIIYYVQKRKEGEIQNGFTGRGRVSSDYVIAVPSYNRLDTFKQKSGRLLTEYNLWDKTFLFLQTPKDIKEYGKAFPQANIIPAPKGITNVNNFIYSYFPLNQEIVCLHDDVSKVIELSSKKKVRSVEDLDLMFKVMFKVMRNEGCNLAGLYPIPSATYMNLLPPITRDLRFIYDPLQLIINKRRKRRKGFEGKTDYVFTIDNYKKDGCVLRFNHYSFRTIYNPNREGGVGYRDRKKEIENTNKFLQTYGNYVSRVITHKDGTTGIVLKKNPAG